jgi:hypothetical protein
MRAETQTAESAKQFLLTKVLEQAGRDGVSLSEIEKRMLLFSEQSGSDEDMQAEKEFDATCDDQRYEAKISKLFRRAYAYDKKTVDEKNSWKEALDALRKADIYMLVMVDQAGIPRSKSYRTVLSAFDPEDVLFAIFEVGVFATGFVIVFDPFRWGLVHSDWVRLSVMLISIGICWFVGNLWGQRMVSRKFASQQKNPQLDRV